MCASLPPHGVSDTHRGPDEGGEAEECDEDRGHLADSVWLPGRLTVHHHAALWGKTKRRPASEGAGGITTDTEVKKRVAKVAQHTTHCGVTILTVYCEDGDRSKKNGPYIFLLINLTLNSAIQLLCTLVPS